MAITPLLRHTQLLRVLSHPLRLRVAALLRGGELRVCQIGAVFALPFSTVSTHLAALRQAGVVEERREGRGVSYRLRRDAAAVRILRGLWAGVDADPVLQRDHAMAKRVLAVAPEDLCVANLDLSKATCASRARAKQSGSARWHPYG